MVSVEGKTIESKNKLVDAVEVEVLFGFCKYKIFVFF